MSKAKYSEKIVEAIDLSEEVQEIIRQAESTIYAMALPDSFLPLYRAAINFLKNLSKQKITKIYEDKSQKHETQWSLTNYKILFNFQEEIQKFLGNKPSKIIYVLDMEEDVKSYVFDAESFGEELVDQYGRVKSLSTIPQKSLEQKLSESEEKITKHIKWAKSAFLGTKNRLNTFWEQNNSSQKQSGILMWKEHKKWQKAKIINLGDVREAYATALMINHEDKMDKLCSIRDSGSPKYYSHALIGNFFHNYINKVTNKPAITGEDIDQANIYFNDYQYGVKSIGATIPGLSLYHDFAIQILKFNPQEKLKQWIEDIKNDPNNNKKRNLLINDLSKEMKEKLKQVIEQIDNP